MQDNNADWHWHWRNPQNLLSTNQYCMCKTIYIVLKAFFHILSKLMNSWFPFFCCHSKYQSIFSLLLYHFLFLPPAFRVWRLSNKPHKDFSFPHVVSWGNRVHFMLCGFSGNKQVNGVHVCIVFPQPGYNFDPVIPI